MSDKTHIQWCDATFNPWIGCTKVSPGCAHCYAEGNTATRAFGVEWGKGQERHRTGIATWAQVRMWNKRGICLCGAWVNRGEPNCVKCWRSIDTGQPLRRPRVFCASLSDWLDDEVPIEWLADLLKLIHETPNLDWLMLTKRPENWNRRLCSVMNAGLPYPQPANFVLDWVDRASPPDNVWFGVSIEDQARAEERIPALLKIPARVRFLSVEPLLGPLDLGFTMNGAASEDEESWAEPTEAGCKIHWVIVGGESGPKARPCHVEWVRSIVGQCNAASVACFVKQLGSNSIDPSVPWRKASGAMIPFNHPKGGEPSEWPEDLRVRQFPNDE